MTVHVNNKLAKIWGRLLDTKYRKTDSVYLLYLNAQESIDSSPTQYVILYDVLNVSSQNTITNCY